MTLIDDLLDLPPYSLAQKDKEAILIPRLNALTAHHVKHCSLYAQLLRSMFGNNVTMAQKLTDVPYIPVPLFKSYSLKSVSDEAVFKTLVSSGTTSDMPSRIYLDRETSERQTIALTKLLSSHLGKTRLPMLIIDAEATLKNKDRMSARAAGIVGLMRFGKDYHFALDEQMGLDKIALDRWLKKHQGGPVLLFGFTFMVWKYFYEPLKSQGIDLSQAILLHGGGWKKMQDGAVTRDIFKKSLLEAFQIRRVHNFYGMVEQVGSISLECESGYFHAPLLTDVAILNPQHWNEASQGEEGVIQTFSLIPTSYPGHSLLTEDMGIVAGVDDCPCGAKGKYFTVVGRIPNVQLRGCSDTHITREIAG